MLDRETAKTVVVIERYSDRIMMVRLSADPVDMVLLQVYMLTSDHEDEEIEEMYEKLDEILAGLKGSDNVVLMGDFNSVV